MEKYTNNILINSGANAIYEALTSSINKWWSTDFEGSAVKVNDEFEVRFGSSFKKVKVEEVAAHDLKWNVLDAFIHLESIQNKKEWIGTEIHWNITPIDDQKSKLTITHVGLTKQLDCFEVCDIGWGSYLASIKNYVESKAGHPFEK